VCYCAQLNESSSSWELTTEHPFLTLISITCCLNLHNSFAFPAFEHTCSESYPFSSLHDVCNVCPSARALTHTAELNVKHDFQFLSCCSSKSDICFFTCTETNTSVLSMDTWTPLLAQIGLARTVYIHCAWHYSWWFPRPDNRIYTVFTHGSGQLSHINGYVTACSQVPQHLAPHCLYIWLWPSLHINGYVTAFSQVPEHLVSEDRGGGW